MPIYISKGPSALLNALTQMLSPPETPSQTLRTAVSLTIWASCGNSEVDTQN